MPERHRFLRGMVSWIGFNRTYVPFQAPRRTAGESKYTTLKMLSLAIDALFSFSAAPMRMATRCGLALLVPGALYFFYILVRYVALDDFVRGWGSLIGTLMIIGGVQLIFIGMVGEYLARIFEESKRRPLYFFKQTPDDVGH
jgi:polyisoprenyl-phosphate glycosyltransferase